MSGKRPQNGPSFSKAPYKKQKPLSDAEQAELRRKKQEREEEVLEKSRAAQTFVKALKSTGGVVPMRGVGASAFWSKVDQPKTKK